MLKSLDRRHLEAAPARSCLATAAPRAYGVGGDVDMTTIALFVEARALSRALGAIGPLSLDPVPDAPPEMHPVCVDLWQVDAGRAEVLGIDQHRWSKLVGAAGGATAVGSLGAMVGAGSGGISGASLGGMMGAWLGPVGFWWGASAGLLAGGSVGGAVMGMTASAAGAALGGAAARGFSEEASRIAGTYREASILVPCVTAPDLDEPSLLVEEMLTDSPLAKWLSEMIGFGFNKRLSTIQRSAERWGIRSPEGRPLLTWTADPASPARWAPAGALPEFAALRRWLAQPLLGHLDGRLALSRLDRFYDDPSALVAPVDGRLDVAAGISACVPPGEHPVGGVSPARAFAAARVPVRLTYPTPIAG